MNRRQHPGGSPIGDRQRRGRQWTHADAGIIALGGADLEHAAAFWSAVLGYQRRQDGYGVWANVLIPSDGRGTPIALEVSKPPPEHHPRLHLDLHVADAAEQTVEAERLVVLADPDGNRFCIVDRRH